MFEYEFLDLCRSVFGPFEIASDLLDHFCADFSVKRVVRLCVTLPEPGNTFSKASDRKKAFVDRLVDASERFPDIMQQSCPANDGIVFDELDGFFAVFEEAQTMVGGVLVIVVLDP